jgi:hypothetical protein
MERSRDHITLKTSIELVAPGLRSPGDRIMLANKPVRVDIQGDVKIPGPVYLYNGETLAQALNEAGGINGTSSTAHVTLTRAPGRKADVSAAGTDFIAPAHNGDVVTMHPAPQVNVYGMVTTPARRCSRAIRPRVPCIVRWSNKYADLKHIEVVHNNASVVRYFAVDARRPQAESADC